jgi:hypothetical protein
MDRPHKNITSKSNTTPELWHRKSAKEKEKLNNEMTLGHSLEEGGKIEGVIEMGME